MTTDPDNAAPHSSAGLLSEIRLSGSIEAPVKKLSGFKKNVHTVPDADTPATNAFLSKICATELQEEAEGFFQKARDILGYKRREIALHAAAGNALLQTRDFSLEWQYAISPDCPAHYQRNLLLHNISPAADISSPSWDSLFSSLFDHLEFVLTRPHSVEAIIDAVEALPPPASLRVDYPSDCRTCTLSTPDISAQVIFSGHLLTMRFPSPGSPGELFDSFLRLRSAFSLTRSTILGTLL